MGPLYLALTVLLTVYGQLMLKWRMDLLGSLPDGGLLPKLFFLLRALLDWGVLSTFVAGFLGSLTWMAAMTHFDISFAYPFMSLAFVLVLIFSVLLLGEPLTFAKCVGMLLIVAGIIVSARSH